MCHIPGPFSIGCRACVLYLPLPNQLASKQELQRMVFVRENLCPNLKCCISCQIKNLKSTKESLFIICICVCVQPASSSRLYIGLLLKCQHLASLYTFLSSCKSLHFHSGSVGLCVRVCQPAPSLPTCCVSCWSPHVFVGANRRWLQPQSVVMVAISVWKSASSPQVHYV